VRGSSSHVRQSGIDVGHGADEADYHSLNEVKIGEKQEGASTHPLLLSLLILQGLLDVHVDLLRGGWQVPIAHIINAHGYIE
jgi:hypothetical protein